MNKQTKVNYGMPTNAQVTKRAHQSRSEADSGYLGFERGAEAFERVQREAYPAQTCPRSAYSYIVGDTPILGPADCVGARSMLQRVEQALEKGGWTRSEWARLYKLHTKWKARADGKDVRFNTVGNRQGGLQGHEAKHVRTVHSIRTLLDGGESD